MDDIHEPLERYRDELKDAFRKNAEEAFAEIEQKAAVDKEANKATCKKIEHVNELITNNTNKISGFKWLKWLMIAAAVVLFLLPFISYTVAANTWMIVLFIVLGIALIVLAFTAVQKKIRVLTSVISDLNTKRKTLIQEAQAQMKSLNALFSWDIPTKLIEKTVPNIHFDPYFNAARVKQLSEEFGYTGSLNRDSSVLFSHSGEIKGNPFVIATTRNFQMGVKTYTGHLTIYWEEEVTDSDGKTHYVTRSETLTASVTKPCPLYEDRTFVMYANEAAPDLSFSREPEGLSDDAPFVDLKKKIKRKNLERFSRKMNDESDYTMMANQDFEVLFSTKDRDNEVQYRLLFTPLAQKALVTLMQDKQYGYGDDFTIVKTKMINVVYPKHLQKFDINTDPEKWMDYNFDIVKQRFLRVNQEYFRAVYFAFAPLLSIPLYQQTRTRKEIYGRDLLGDSSFWEWESIANFKGESGFMHPRSITPNILKTSLLHSNDNGTKEIEIQAYGFSGTNRLDYISVFGGDGHIHKVPVPWVQYDPVHKRSTMAIKEFPEADTEIIRNDSRSTRHFRRRIAFDD